MRPAGGLIGHNRLCRQPQSLCGRLSSTY